MSGQGARQRAGRGRSRRPTSEAVASLDRRFLAPAPPQRLAALRLLVGGYALGYLVARLPHWLAVARFDGPRFEPVGPLWFLDGPVPPGVSHGVLAAAVLAGAGFVAGWRWRVSGPAFAVAFLLVTTYRSSWGQVFHTENLVALHLLLLALAPAADAWSLGRRRTTAPSARARRPAQRSWTAYGWPVRLVSVATVLTYVVSGWAKVRNGGLDWLVGDVLRNQVAHDNLRKALMGDLWSPLAETALAHGWIFPPMAVASVAVELLAPLALLRGRFRLAWVGGAWCFHVGVLALMAIAFPYQLTGIVYASLFPVERLREVRPRARRRLRRLRGRGPASAGAVDDDVDGGELERGDAREPVALEQLQVRRGGEELLVDHRLEGLDP